MRVEKLGGRKVELLDSIDELTMQRFHKYNKYALIDANIGSDLQDVNQHIKRTLGFMLKEPESARIELENMKQNLFFIIQETSPKYMSFACLIKSIDGIELDDLTDQVLSEALKKIQKTPVGILDKLIRVLKKKIENELDLYFSGTFNDSEVKEYYDKLKERTILQLVDIKNKTKVNKTKIDELDLFLLLYVKPSTFVGKESLEIDYDSKFVDLCLFIEHQLNAEPEKMTVLKFYKALDYIKKLNKNGGKSSKT